MRSLASPAFQVVSARKLWSFTFFSQKALFQFAGLVAAQFERSVLDAAIVKAMRAPGRPAGLPEGVLEGLPEGPGVYLFYGENALPIYIGKSVSAGSGSTPRPGPAAH